MGGAGYAGTVADWRAACAAAATQGDARASLKTTSRLMPSAAATALFTGYYEPEIRGSRTPARRLSRRRSMACPPIWCGPIWACSIPSLQGEHISGRLDGHTLVPYATRAEIDAKASPTRAVLFYTDDPVAFFFLQIQGSGRVVFDDGSTARIAYAGENGQPYTAIGRTLIADGVADARRGFAAKHPRLADGPSGSRARR